MEHRHIWSVWMPHDRGHKYRYCLDQTCKHVDIKEVKS